MLLRLRWGAFGLRGRIVGAVVVTTAVTLVVAALVLLPQLEDALRKASRATLVDDVNAAWKSRDLNRLQSVTRELWLVNPSLADDKSDQGLAREARAEINALSTVESTLIGRLGTPSMTLIGYIDSQGSGVEIVPPVSPSDAAAVTESASTGRFPGVVKSFEKGSNRYGFNTYGGKQYVTAAIWLGHDSVLAVRKSIDEIPLAVKAVRRAFAYAALAAILLTMMIAIPLAVHARQPPAKAAPSGAPHRHRRRRPHEFPGRSRPR